MKTYQLKSSPRITGPANLYDMRSTRGEQEQTIPGITPASMSQRDQCTAVKQQRSPMLQKLAI